MKKNPLVSGIIAAACPIPLAVITILWSWVCIYPIGTDLLHYGTMPGWIVGMALLPSIFGLLVGIAAFLLGFVKYQTKKAWLAITLSVVGVIEGAIIIDRLIPLISQF